VQDALEAVSVGRSSAVAVALACVLGLSTAHFAAELKACKKQPRRKRAVCKKKAHKKYAPSGEE
jgi:hypothetical protein